MSLQEKGREGDLDTETYRKEDHMRMEAGTGGILPQTKVAGHHQKLEETKEDSLLEPSRESKALLTS